MAMQHAPQPSQFSGWGRTGSELLSIMLGIVTCSLVPAIHHMNYGATIDSVSWTPNSATGSSGGMTARNLQH